MSFIVLNMTASHFHLGDTLYQSPANSTLLIATVWTINHIYAGNTNSLTFSLWSRTATDDSLQTELLSEILTGIRTTELTYVIENSDDVQCGDSVLLKENPKQNCLLRESAVVMVDSIEAFMLFKQQLVKRNYRIAGLFSIIYTGRDRHYYDSILRIFEELFAIYVTNVNVYVEMPMETLVFSFYPFSEYHCYAPSAVLHNRFSMENGFIYDKPFFPRKADNLYGCEVTVATWNGPPFVFFRRMQNGEVRIMGKEGAILRMLAVKMNFTIRLLETADRGFVRGHNHTATGAVKLIIEGIANITINSYIYSEFLLTVMAASYTYDSHRLIVAVPRGRSLSPFQRLLRPFKYIIWSCLSSSVLAGITIIFIIKCLQKKAISDFVFGSLNTTPFTNLLNIFFGGPVTVLPRRNFARYVLLVWLLYTMVLRNAYSGELFIMLQDSSSRINVRKVEELIQQDFTLMCTDNTLNIIFGSIRAPKMEIIKGQPFAYLAKLLDSESKMAVIVLRPFLRLFNQKIRGIGPVRTLPKDLLTVPMTMYLPRNSYILDAINQHLVAFQAVGMMKIWNRFYLPGEEVMQEEVDGEPAVLSVHLLMGLFSAYLLFSGFSILVFALEVWSRYSPICHFVVDFLNF